jgi:hypothetical protein
MLFPYAATTRRPELRSEPAAKVIGIGGSFAGVGFADGGMQMKARVRLVGPPIGVEEPMQRRLVRGSMNIMWKPSFIGTAR